MSKICENEIFYNDMIKSEEGMNASDKFIPCNSTIYCGIRLGERAVIQENTWQRLV